MKKKIMKVLWENKLPKYLKKDFFEL